jgi:hypothetical protein
MTQKNLCLDRTAWWGWEDSNFQPGGYCWCRHGGQTLNGDSLDFTARRLLDPPKSAPASPLVRQKEVLKCNGAKIRIRAKDFLLRFFG